MKKIISIILMILTTFMLCTPVAYAKDENAKNKVNVYVFTREKCDACNDTIKYLYDLQQDNNEDLFNIYKLEVWDKNEKVLSNDARNIMIDVYDYFNNDKDKVGTPTIVIGEYFNIGFPSEHEILYDAIQIASENEDYVDHVKNFAKKHEINIKDFKYVKTISYIDIMIIGVCIIIIIGLVLIIIKRNHK